MLGPTLPPPAVMPAPLHPPVPVEGSIGDAGDQIRLGIAFEFETSGALGKLDEHAARQGGRHLQQAIAVLLASAA